MTYLYYPGCSLTGTAVDYDMSARAVMEALGVPLTEMDDWNCCGAGAAPSVDPDLGAALSARNMVLAEAVGKDVAVACPFCYTNLRRASALATAPTPAGKRLRKHLAGSESGVRGSSQVQHLLAIIVTEIGLDAVRRAVKRPLTGLKVAPYYGCQLGRPKGAFAHPEIPTEMDALLEALGATPVVWSGRTRCCGASTMLTKESAALRLVDDLLTRAEESQAQIVATACSFCQLNLDAYQDRINAGMDRNHHLPVVYFTQLMGLAFGLEPKRLGLGKQFVPPEPVLASYLTGVN